MKVVGLGGTNGSGKDTVGNMLAERHGYLFVSGSDILREEARRRNLSTGREVLRVISAEWRREYGPGMLIDKAIEKASSLGAPGVAIASLRHPGEADRVHELGGRVVWVDADPKVRYVRIQNNAALRGRADEDNKTFEEFLAEEAAEMNNTSGDEAALDMQAVKDRSDITILNNGNDLQTFYDEAEAALGLSSKE